MPEHLWTSSHYSRHNLWCQDEKLVRIASELWQKHNEEQKSTTVEGKDEEEKKKEGNNDNNAVANSEKNVENNIGDRKEKEEEANANAVTIIPKMLHFIWLGEKLPQKFFRLIQSWRAYHPSWKIIVWDDNQAESLEMVNKDRYRAASNFGTKSDILRYEILYQLGGVYVDVDYECIRPLDSVLGSCALFAGFSNTEALELNNGLMGCIPRHFIVEKMINEIADGPITNLISGDVFDNIAKYLGSSNSVQLLSKGQDIISRSGPGLLTRAVYSVITSLSEAAYTDRRIEANGDRIVLFPIHLFHPLPNYFKVTLGEKEDEISALKLKYLRPETVAIHWWQRSWQ